MIERYFISAALLAALVMVESPEAVAQLKLVQTIRLTSDVTGHFDHFGVDLKHDRLFVTSASSSVLVLNIRTGKSIHHIEGIGKPAAILYIERI